MNMEAFPRDPSAPADKVPLAKHRWPRDPHDWYVEPPEVTEALLTVERFVGRSWDPCCGQGNITGALIAAGVEAVGTDLVDRGADRTRHGWQGTHDFLADDYWLPGAPNVVSNPPFRSGLLESCIRKALRHAPGKVAPFVPARFIWGSERADTLFAEFPEQRHWLLLDRPSCPPGHLLEAGAVPGNGQGDWAWLVWDRTVPPTGAYTGRHLHSRRRGTTIGARPIAAPPGRRHPRRRGRGPPRRLRRHARGRNGYDGDARRRVRPTAERAMNRAPAPSPVPITARVTWSA